jgi:hypothetical protein
VGSGVENEEEGSAATAGPDADMVYTQHTMHESNKMMR